MQIRQAKWADEYPLMSALRFQVFVDEQGVSPDIELDEHDPLPSTHHFIAEVDGEVVATGRLSEGGKLGRICVAAPLRGQGLGSELLREMVITALDTGQTVLYLHAQVAAIPLYQKSGFVVEGPSFMEANIEHRRMVFDFKSQEALEAIYQNRVVRLESPEKFSQHLCRMLGAGHRQLQILSQHLDPLVYSSEVSGAVSEFARSHRHTSIKILVHDTRPLVSSSHPLVLLCQRLPSIMAIKGIHDSPQQADGGFVLVDRRQLVFFNDEPNYQGFASYRARPEAANKLEAFDRLWQYHSREDPNLRRLDL